MLHVAASSAAIGNTSKMPSLDMLATEAGLLSLQQCGKYIYFFPFNIFSLRYFVTSVHLNYSLTLSYQKGKDDKEFVFKMLGGVFTMQWKYAVKCIS